MTALVPDRSLKCSNVASCGVRIWKRDYLVPLAIDHHYVRIVGHSYRLIFTFLQIADNGVSFPPKTIKKLSQTFVLTVAIIISYPQI
jgi:hypothetical protein